MTKYDNTKIITSIKEGKYLKKADIIVAIVMVFMLIGLLCLIFMPNGESVVVKVNGEVKYIYSLSDNVEVKIEVDGEKDANILVIKDGYAYMKSATCKNQVCVHMGKISKVGETINCAPHKVLVEIVGKGVGVDTIV